MFPVVKYFLLVGKEESCLKEIQDLLFQLRQFKGIQIVVVIAFDVPLPRLSVVLNPLLDVSCSGFVRMVTLSPERSPSRILRNIQGVKKEEVKQPKNRKGKEKQEEDDNPFLVAINKTKQKPKEEEKKQVEERLPVETEMSVDPFRILENLERDKFMLQSNDFFPFSVLSVLEPFVRLLGYGNYSFKAHPFCGFIACLISVENKLVPLSRYLNLSRFYASVAPLLPQLNAPGADIGFLLARKLKSIFYDCMIKNNEENVEILSFLTEEEKMKETETFIRKIVLLTIHNNMDLAAFDLMRRCQCASVTSTPLTENKLAASCTACV